MLHDEDLRRRVLHDAARVPSLTRGQRRRQSVVLFGAAALVVALVFAGAGGVRADTRPLALLLATSAGSAACALAAMVVALGRGRSMLGRSRVVLLAASVLLPLALVLWKIDVSALYTGMSAAWPARPGFRCLRLSLATGLLALVAALFARRGSEPLHPSSAGGAVGVASGLVAATLVDLWCPVAHLEHLLVGHLLPIVLLALAGAAAGARVLATAPAGRRRLR